MPDIHREVSELANTPKVSVRVEPDQLDAARAAVGAADLDAAVLLRAGLLVLAGLTVREALKNAQAQRGPKPKAEART